MTKNETESTISTAEIFELSRASPSLESQVMTAHKQVRFFGQPHNPSPDGLHKALADLPSLQARLTEIRKDLFDCCAVEAPDGQLVVVDKDRFDILADEQQKIAAKIRATLGVITKLDDLFRVAQEHRVAIPIKSISGIAGQIQVIQNEIDRNGFSMNADQIPHLKELLAEAREIWAESGL